MSTIPNLLKLKDYVTLTGTSLGLIALICGIIGGLGQVSLGFFLLTLTLGTDLLDGYLARKTGTINEIGKQLDSLSDSLTFGIAPAMLAFEAFKTESVLDIFLGISCTIFAIGAILRLARFNISEDPGYTGIPTPLSGLFLILFFYANFFLIVGTGERVLPLPSSIIISFLMILFAWFNITTYITFKEKGKKIYILFIILAPTCPFFAILNVINISLSLSLISMMSSYCFFGFCIIELIFIAFGFYLKLKNK
ncbi:MAG: CDP-alcohol phosphatidyltransferase family protein [Promethearchaeota archaeon]